ncbi:hypothetical protein P171DRAFT_438548 [Karstenula rhodostoma CBS 690.94]|uniref:Uncharacterized protein n=1 Tax=Karstenula rhodostoma CBS 690.94 TaxID=1392251 RepID=A0A9P4PX84_9PLEO|nr:hypothetical protein P171DRAFT_438548 [Karstenula rhodostoma CBS 690.94]
MDMISFKASLDNTSLPVDQAVIDTPLRQLADKDRRALGLGPAFKVMVGEKMIAQNIPKRAAMAISKFFNDILTKHPRSTTFMLNDTDVSEDCVRSIVDFIIGNVKVNNTFALRNKKMTFPREVALYRHVICLFGMEQHAGPMRTALVDCLNKDIHLPTYASLNELVQLPENDPLYKCAVRCMEGLEHIGEMDGDEDWLVWLNDNYKFQIDMEFWKEEREARKAVEREAQRAGNFESNFPTLK